MNQKVKKSTVIILGILAVILNVILYVGLGFLKGEKGHQFISSVFSGGSGLELFLLTIFLFLALIIAGGVFWIIMLVHAATKPIENKTLWILILLFGWIFGAILYYYMVKKNWNNSTPTVAGQN